MDSLQLMKEFLKAGDRFRRMDLGALHPGITHGEFVLLERIHSHSRQYGDIFGAHASDLVRELAISPPAISRMLRTLEQKGMLVRESDRNDRRNICVCLTEPGRRTQENGHKMLMSFARDTVDHMGEDQMMELIRLWNRLADVLQAELMEYGKGE